MNRTGNQSWSYDLAAEGELASNNTPSCAAKDVVENSMKFGAMEKIRCRRAVEVQQE